MILNAKLTNIIFISGDVHYAELSRLSCGSREIYELTSSGLTHTCDLQLLPGACEIVLKTILHHKLRVGNTMIKILEG